MRAINCWIQLDHTVITRKLWIWRQLFESSYNFKKFQLSVNKLCKQTNFPRLVSLTFQVKLFGLQKHQIQMYCYDVVFLFRCFMIITVSYKKSRKWEMNSRKENIRQVCFPSLTYNWSLDVSLLSLLFS